MRVVSPFMELACLLGGHLVSHVHHRRPNPLVTRAGQRHRRRDFYSTPRQFPGHLAPIRAASRNKWILEKKGEYDVKLPVDRGEEPSTWCSLFTSLNSFYQRTDRHPRTCSVLLPIFF